MKNELLIFIPTYNELENVEKLISQIFRLKLKDFNLLFTDDNSPDGTGRLLDNLSKKNKQIIIIHRRGKLGIGSAHLKAINWAYDHHYQKLITMDADFSHNPLYIKKLLEVSDNYALVTTSRYLRKNSLMGWNILRKILTFIGHFLTKNLLKMNYDASSAFRLYNLNRIPRKIFNKINSQSYSFFFESLYLLNFHKIKIGEISIKLPVRTYGHSKMKPKDLFLSIKFLFTLYFQNTKF